MLSSKLIPVTINTLLKGLRRILTDFWSSGQSSWLQIQKSGFYSQHYQIFSEVVGLELGSLSLVSTTEELIGRKCSGSGVEIREYGCRGRSRWPRGTLYPQKLALTSPTSAGLSVGIVRSRIQATEFFSFTSNLTNYFLLIPMILFC
jgi:hypothetical protein